MQKKRAEEAANAKILEKLEHPSRESTPLPEEATPPPEPEPEQEPTLTATEANVVTEKNVTQFSFFEPTSANADLDVPSIGPDTRKKAVLMQTRFNSNLDRLQKA